MVPLIFETPISGLGITYTIFFFFLGGGVGPYYDPSIMYPKTLF